MEKTCKVCSQNKSRDDFYHKTLVCKVCFKTRYIKTFYCIDCGTERKVNVTTKEYKYPRCRKCAQKLEKNKPEYKKIQSELSRKQLITQGGIKAKGEHKRIRGKDHYRWKGGITDALMKIRTSWDMGKWRAFIFTRDNFTCKRCGQVGGKLNAHHIKSFSEYPDLRLDVSNGVTLCKGCHIKLHRSIKMFKRIFLTAIFIFSLFTNTFSQTQRYWWAILNQGAAPPPPTTKNFTLTVIPTTDVDLLAPMRGANTFFTNTQWANIPVAATAQWSLDNQYRFYWSLMNTGNGVYNFSDFDTQVQQSISRRQRFEFRVTTCDTDIPNAYPVPTAGGGKLVYPSFVHTQMQAEAVKDWTYNNGTQTCWIPNWNSTSYLTAWQTFCVELNNHIMTTSFQGVQFMNVVRMIDIAGYGNYSEWHSFPFINNYPSNAQKATQATLQQIVQIHLNAYPNWPSMGNINMWVGECGAIPAFGYFVFFATNTWGRVGILNDHFGWTTTYNNDVPNNNRNFNGVVFGTQIQLQYQVAPISGEPMNDAAAVTNGGSCAFWHMQTEILAYHASEFNNQNGTGSGTNVNCVGDNYRASSKSCGYRIQVNSGTVTTNMPSGSNMQITLNWQNAGIAPVYENWNVQISLVNAGNVTVFTGNSSKVLKLFLTGTANTTDNFSLPALPAGVYSVRVKIVDPTAYRNPFPLYNTGVAADGSYLLTTITIV